MSDPRDEKIYAALDAGDYRTALKLMMAIHGSTVHSYCFRILGHTTLAEDVNQIVFIQAFAALPAFERRSSVSTWLLAIAHNRCLDALKKHRRQPAPPPATPPERADSAPPADERLAQHTLAQALIDCLDELPPAIRAAVLLRYQGRSFKEIAALLKDKAGTLQARVARALPILKECLRRKGFCP